jgi:hypothetical protein
MPSTPGLLQHRAVIVNHQNGFRSARISFPAVTGGDAGKVCGETAISVSLLKERSVGRSPGTIRRPTGWDPRSILFVFV